MGLKAGIAGYGLAGAVFHAPLIEAVDDLEVAAVMTRNPERAAAARAAHADVRVVESVGELLEGIDVLVVASPNSSHAEIALFVATTSSSMLSTSLSIESTTRMLG